MTGKVVGAKSALQKERDPGTEKLPENVGDVFVNVYDITPRINSCLRRCCCSKNWGIYHSGVEVHGLEVSFGGHDDSSTGVFCARPRSACGAVFYQQLPVGHIKLDPLELRSTIAEISGKWPGNSYDTLERNCNHFTDACCWELLGHGAPTYVNRCAASHVVKCVFNRCLVPLARCLERCRFLRPPAVTYSDDEGLVAGENAGQLGIEGARGINQVLVEAATIKKTNANEMYKSGSHQEARDAYLKAFSYLKQLSHRNEDEDEVVNQATAVRVALLLNIAACDLKLQQYSAVVENCNNVLQLEADNRKARYRRGVAYSYLGRLEESMVDLRDALQATDSADNGTIRDIRREIDRVKSLMEEKKEEEKSMARRMLGGTAIGRREVPSDAPQA